MKRLSSQRTSAVEITRLSGLLAKSQKEITERPIDTEQTIVNHPASSPFGLTKNNLAGSYTDMANRLPILANPTISLVCELAPDGTTLFVNDSVTDLTGHPSTELLGKNWWTDFFFPDMDINAREDLRRRFHGGSVNLEMDLKTRDGTTRKLIWNSYNTYSSDGAHKSTIALGIDTSAGKTAPRILEDSPDEREHLFGESPIGILVCDSEGRLLDINRACMNIFDVSDESTMQGLLLSYDSTLFDRVRDGVTGGRITRFETPFDFEEVRTRKLFETSRSGRIYLDIMVSPMYRQKDNSYGAYLVHVQDMSARKKAEAELRKSQDELEMRVQERTSQLATIAEELRVALTEAKQSKAETAALLDGARAILEHQEFPDAVQPMFCSLIKLIGAKSGYVSLMQKGRPVEKMALIAKNGVTCEVDASLPLPLRGLRQKVKDSHEVLFVNDFPSSSYAQYIPQGHEYLENVLLAPLVVKNKVAGFLGLANKPGGFTENDVKNAKAFGELAAVALQNSDMLESLENSITERRLAEINLRESLDRLHRTLEGTIEAMAFTVENKDPYTAGHQQRVARLACEIAQDMGLSEEQLHVIRLAATIHDIGKLLVPAEILSRPGKLNEIEFSLIKTHAQTGYDLLKRIHFPWPLAEIVSQHHERMDGSGYPLGLKGEEISLEARIIGVADVVEAMASHRPYRPALGLHVALEEISKNKGILYDSQVVDACLKVVTERKFLLQ